MSKKILSLALAVVMLVSVFTIAASAAYPISDQIGLRVVTDAYVGMPEGETVTAKVYLVLPDDTDFDTYRQGLSAVMLFYTDAFEYVDGSRVWGAYASGYIKDDAQVTTPTATVLTNAIKKFSADDAARGWTDARIFAQAYAQGTTASPTTGYEVNPYDDLFTVEFTTTRELEETDSIGIPTSTFASQTKPQYINASSRTTAYKAAQISADEVVENAAYLNVSDATAFLLRNNADDANTLDVGVRATFMDASFPVTFTGASCNELENIGIDARINGEVKTGLEGSDLNFIYRNATDDGYDFVGAITGVDDLDAKIEIRAYFIADGQTYYSNWVAVKAGLRYDDAVANGMSAIA